MDWPLSYNEIAKYANAMKRWNIVQYICQIRCFFFNPAGFWNNYKHLSASGKAIQFLTYATLMILVGLACSHNISGLRECCEVLLVEMFSFSPFIIAIIAGLFLISPRSIKQLALGAFVISCYSKFLFGIFEISFLRVYISSESYFYLSFAILTAIAGEVYAIVISAFWCTNNNRIRLLRIIAILLVIGFVDMFYPKFCNTSTSDNYSDVITRERFDLGQRIKDPYLVPTYVVSIPDFQQTYYLYSVPGDTLASLRDLTPETFIARLNEDLDSLRSITKASKFRTNRDFFRAITTLKQKIRYVHNSKSYLRNPPINTSGKDRNEAIDEIRYFNESISSDNDSLCISDFEMSEKYSNALWPINLRYIYRPALYFVNKAY